MNETEKYGLDPSSIPDNPKGIPARVTAVYQDLFEVVCDRGQGLARLKPGEYYGGDGLFPTTGDFVLLNWQENGESLILKTLERRTYFSRRDPSSSGYGEQAVAANFDHVFILQPLDQDFNPRRLERYLTLAWQSGVTPAVILTKADQVEDATVMLAAAQGVAAGVNIHALSARTGQGMNQLDRYLKQGKTIVLLGMSGAGKSSLLNALAGREVMAVNRIRQKDGRGRHTTTRRQLTMLDCGAMVIDTPGMRELGMWDVSQGLGQSFADVEQFLGHCKFSDCRHQSEPGCAIKEAIRNQTLSQERWEAYLRLKEEARFSSDKAGYLRDKQQWEKGIARQIRNMAKMDYRNTPCTESFTCQVCGNVVVPEEAGSRHRNHCPHCLSSIHADHKPGDRASLCRGIMDPIGVWVRKNGEWAIIHRCRQCGALSSNRIAADDNPSLLMSIAVKPLASPPFPHWEVTRR